MKNLKLDPKNMPADVVGWVCLAVAWACILLSPFSLFFAGLGLVLVALMLGIIAISQKKIRSGVILTLLALMGSPLLAFGSFSFWAWFEKGGP